MYAVSPTGKELWAYDTGDVIRSSPVIGLAPDGVHRIVYFGAGNGVLYALNATDGSRRWSYDTTRPDPILRDRNDLNSSPALTRTGVVIGGEDGYLKYVPYDYCLHRRDPRCSTSPGDAFPPDLNRVYAVTSGGNTQLGGGAQPVGPASVMPLRLVVRSKGETLDASMQPLPDAASLVQTSPQFPFTAQLSGDGHYMFVVPDGFLTPGRDYTIKLAGHYTANGLSVGDIRLGGTSVGSFGSGVSYHVAPPAGPLPLHNRPGRVAAFRLTRLAFPLPALLTSVNQIGFDQYNLIVGALTIKPTGGGSGSILLWAVGARPGPNGAQQVDPHTTLTFPLAGGYQHDSLLLQSQNTTLTFSFGPVPAQRLVVRAQLSRSLVARPGADIYAEVSCPDVPFYGPLLPTLRLCNNQDKLISNGTFVTSAYGSRGTANQRPRGLGVAGVTLSGRPPSAAGSAVATLTLARGAHYPAANHLVSIVLTDAATGAPVGLNYSANIKNVADGHGDIERAELTIPAGTSLPARFAPTSSPTSSRWASTGCNRSGPVARGGRSVRFVTHRPRRFVITLASRIICAGSGRMASRGPVGTNSLGAHDGGVLRGYRSPSRPRSSAGVRGGRRVRRDVRRRCDAVAASCSREARAVGTTAAEGLRPPLASSCAPWSAGVPLPEPGPRPRGDGGSGRHRRRRSPGPDVREREPGRQSDRGRGQREHVHGRARDEPYRHSGGRDRRPVRADPSVQLTRRVRQGDVRVGLVVDPRSRSSVLANGDPRDRLRGRRAAGGLHLPDVEQVLAPRPGRTREPHVQWTGDEWKGAELLHRHQLLGRQQLDAEQRFRDRRPRRRRAGTDVRVRRQPSDQHDHGRHERLHAVRDPPDP